MKTDEAVDTPTDEEVVSPSKSDTPQDDESSIEEDLKTFLKDAEQEDADDEEAGKEKAEDESDDEDDENIIRQRSDYLKHKAKLREREKELEAREAQLREQEEARSKDSGDDDEENDDDNPSGYVPFSVDIDPDDYELESDRRVVNVVRTVADEVEATRQAISILATHVQRLVSHEQGSRVQFLNGVIAGAQAEITKKFGVEATPKEIGEALATYGQRIMTKKQTGLSPEIAVEAWARDNMDLVQNKAEDKKRPPAITKSSTKRMEKSQLTDDEAILRDFIGT